MVSRAESNSRPERSRPAVSVLQPMMIRGRLFDWNVRTYVMAVINVTPDSFSGDGVAGNQRAVARLAQMAVDGGADIIDVGGESTRPGAGPVPAEEELARVLPAVRTMRSLTDTPISVDTYKAEVAESALEAGADLINDVWALQRDPRIAQTVARAGCPVVLMHNRGARPTKGSIGGHYAGVSYGNVAKDVREELRGWIQFAQDAGIDAERIIVDPGIGFGKTPQQNLELLSRLGELRALGRPLLLGVSRKSFIGFALGDGAADRKWGTAAAIAVGIVNGANLVRVHDVAEMAQVARVADAIVGRRAAKP